MLYPNLSYEGLFHEFDVFFLIVCVLFSSDILKINLIMHRWSGRVALVTGASEGIGEAISRLLVKHDMEVVGCARNLDKLKVSQIMIPSIYLYAGYWLSILIH